MDALCDLGAVRWRLRNILRHNRLARAVLLRNIEEIIMKNSMKLGLATVTIIVASAACSAEVSHTDAVAAYSAEPIGGSEVTNSSTIEPEGDSSEEVGTATQALGKQCYANCTVAKVDASAECPSTISGYGETTFLGGCKKACRKARGDASSKLPSGCVINNCNTSGC